MLIQPMYRISILANFYLNRDYIAEVLCINKDKPELQCAGSCHLSKQLQQADEQEKEIPVAQLQKAEILYLASAFTFTHPTFQKIYLQKSPLPERQAVQAGFLACLLQPPQLG